jgi:hypothetical protein
MEHDGQYVVWKDIIIQYNDMFIIWEIIFRLIETNI